MFAREVIENKHHYETAQQVQKWIALHKAYSPSRIKNGCQALFTGCFEDASRRIPGQRVHVVGLGSGDGAKEGEFIQILKEGEREIIFSPVDVGLGIVLEARENTLQVIPAGINVRPLSAMWPMSPGCFQLWTRSFSHEGVIQNR